MTLPFTIQIPVYNETQALAFSAFYFERLGVHPRYVLDSQRTPAAQAMLEHLGHEPLFFSNDKPFIENGYQNFASVSPTDWILRLDCDETPSRDLIAFCDDFVRRDCAGVVGFERHQVLWNGDHFLTAGAPRLAPVAQRQWRLFNRARVKFDRQIHTPGIHVENPIAAPSAAALYHLSWVFLTWEDRLKKAARYDDHGQPSFNRANQLFPVDDAEWTTLDAMFLRDAYADWLADRAPHLN